MNVRDTVETSLKEQGVPLSPQYQGYADRVIAALETREAEIVSNLMMFATEQGLPRETALDAMADCGLDLPGPTAVVGEDPRIAAMEQQIATLQTQLQQMRD